MGEFLKEMEVKFKYFTVLSEEQNMLIDQIDQYYK